MNTRSAIDVISNAYKLKLRKLSLADEDIENFIYIPYQIGTLENLVELKITGSKITELPQEVGNLTKLEFLDLSARQLVHLPDSIAHLKNLRYFRIHGSLASFPYQIFNLENLEYLVLQRKVATE